MAQEGESLVMRRSKRSTAGNRMEAALAEFRAEDVGVDIEDIDFVIEKGNILADEEDAFESDFESTDEEVAQEDIDAAAENLVRVEERTGRKAARSKLDRVTALAHARHKATFHPQEYTSTQSGSAKLKRRVSLGLVVDAETGEVIEQAKRQSRRMHTMLNTSATVNRMKDAEEKKSTLPKKVKTTIRAPTQDELITRALDMEEGNIKEHRNYLTLEEEKRKRARLVRTSIQGPLVRWISKAEEVTITLESHPTALSHGGPPPFSQPVNNLAYPATSLITPAQPVYPPYYYQPPNKSYTSQSSATTHVYPSSSEITHPLHPKPLVYKEIVNKNYVIHELGQSEAATRPSWPSTMKAMFGDHVKWEDLRVYITKGRPLTRPVQTCPITGRAAQYMDPRTGVPFANMEAYRTLGKILAHEYVWSDSLGCYIGPS
ncbi:uncharacterized protein FIBRA_08757 [Fibroporia radiculosa]|uniref:Vps72/YL1 C-terminal domain-containing protein n=1 Tax=Fibroporia radiculosa TaxID=599839 RepID=J4GI65_9APHY|nr:uncharacterized protein FIBRA_08757 [Fibroporia radiculosa]CCM06488.1 predicted protein [Fibroporia radiculosa]